MLRLREGALDNFLLEGEAPDADAAMPLSSLWETMLFTGSCEALAEPAPTISSCGHCSNRATFTRCNGQRLPRLLPEKASPLRGRLTSSGFSTTGICGVQSSLSKAARDRVRLLRKSDTAAAVRVGTGPSLMMLKEHACAHVCDESPLSSCLVPHGMWGVCIGSPTGRKSKAIAAANAASASARAASADA